MMRPQTSISTRLAARPQAALRGALEVHGAAVRLIAVVEPVEAVEREIGDRQDGEKAQKPPGRDHVGGVPERVVDHLHEEKRRDAQNDGDRDGDLGGRAERAREALQWGFFEKAPQAARPRVPSITLTAVR